LNVCPPALIVSAVELNLAREAAEDGVVAQQCARVALSVRSFTATTSMSAPLATAARKKLRPDAAEAVDTHTNGHCMTPRKRRFTNRRGDDGPRRVEH